MVWSMTLLLVHYKYIAYYINLKCFFCCRNQNNFLGGLGLRLVFFQGLSRYKYKYGLLPSQSQIQDFPKEAAPFV